LPLITARTPKRRAVHAVRLASAASAPILLSDGAALLAVRRFFFTQNYDQEAVNTFGPFVLSPLITFPVSQQSPVSALDDIGIGVYGQGTVTFADRFDASAGAASTTSRRTPS
jgi:hypothetical protein